METRKYQLKKEHPHPHIGRMVRRAMNAKNISQSDLARRMGVSANTVSSYLKNASLQFGIVWDIAVAIQYDFLSELVNYYPEAVSLNEASKVMITLREKEALVADLQKEIAIYKKALKIDD